MLEFLFGVTTSVAAVLAFRKFFHDPEPPTVHMMPRPEVVDDYPQPLLAVLHSIQSEPDAWVDDGTRGSPVYQHSKNKVHIMPFSSDKTAKIIHIPNSPSPYNLLTEAQERILYSASQKLKAHLEQKTREAALQGLGSAFGHPPSA